MIAAIATVCMTRAPPTAFLSIEIQPLAIALLKPTLAYGLDFYKYIIIDD
jgi:hypothetical protein